MGEMGDKDLGSRERDRGLGKEGNTAKNLCLQVAGRDKLRPEDNSSFSVASWQLVQGPKAVSHRAGGV